MAKDNGVGFEVAKLAFKGIGLQNIQARVKLINAKVALKSVPKKGTSLTINYYI